MKTILVIFIFADMDMDMGVSVENAERMEGVCGRCFSSPWVNIKGVLKGGAGLDLVALWIYGEVS